MFVSYRLHQHMEYGDNALLRIFEITLTDEHIPVDPNLHCKSIFAKVNTVSITAADNVCVGSWCHNAFLYVLLMN